MTEIAFFLRWLLILCATTFIMLLVLAAWFINNSIPRINRLANPSRLTRWWYSL